MPTTQRRCANCRHFEPAPLWRKGWCRNPVLYAPHQNHLVDERDLDCDRRFGDYWESIEFNGTAPTAVSATHDGPPSETSQAAPPTSATTHYAAGDEVDEEALLAEDEPVVATHRPLHATGLDVAEERRTSARLPFQFGPVRSQGDLLRLALPALVILLLLVGWSLWATWMWRSSGSQAAGATPGPVDSAALSTSVPTLIAAVPTAANPNPAPANPNPAPPPAANPPAANPPANPNPAPANPNPPATTKPAAGPPPPPSLRAGATAVVDTGPGTDRLRLRREPGRAGVEVRMIPNGQRLSVIEGPRELDGFSWWKVDYSGEIGWVAGSFIRAVS